MATTVTPLADQYASFELRFTLGPIEFYDCRRLDDDAPVLAAIFDLTELESSAAGTITAAADHWARAAVPGRRPIAVHAISESLYAVMTDDPGGVRLVDDSGSIRPFTTARAVHLAVEAARAAAHLLTAGVAVSVLPPGLLREIPGQEIVILHAWLLPILPVVLRLGASDRTPLATPVPPESDAGHPLTSRTAVFAVGQLARRLLEGWPPATGGGAGRVAISPGLERVLRRATSHSPQRRPIDLHDLARELIDGGPANRRNFVPTERLNSRPRRRPFLTRRRPLLPPRPVPEIGPPRVRPWMIALVTSVGIIAFLVILPRIGNPLEPVEDTLIEFRSAFSDPEAPDPDAAATGRLLLLPDFTGRQQAEVQIEAAGLGVNISVEEEVDPSVISGTVIRQEPGPGSRVRTGATLTIVVGRGEAEAFLIAVEDRTALDAREALSELGFVVVEVPAYDKDLPAGIVLRQSPDPGQVLPKGTQVVLEVSRGAQRLTIPSVAGLPEADAARIVTDLGLNVALEPVTDAPVIYQPGEVVAQQPGAGSSVEPGGTVVLRIYQPDAITVPDLRGLDLGQALLAIDAAGLAPGIVQQAPAEEDQRLVVISQSLPPGTPAARNTVIDFQVGPSGP